MFLFRGLSCFVGTPPGMGQLIAACVRIQREWQVDLGYFDRLGEKTLNKFRNCRLSFEKQELAFFDKSQFVFRL
jgi:hypothetical protein